jgi:hypothetical protein
MSQIPNMSRDAVTALLYFKWNDLVAFILSRTWHCNDSELHGVTRFKCCMLELTVTPQVSHSYVLCLGLHHNCLSHKLPSHAQELIVCQLVKKFSTFYGSCHSSDNYFLSQRLVRLQALWYAYLANVTSAPFIGTAIDAKCHLLWVHSRRTVMHPVCELYVEFLCF